MVKFFTIIGLTCGMFMLPMGVSKKSGARTLGAILILIGSILGGVFGTPSKDLPKGDSSIMTLGFVLEFIGFMLFLLAKPIEKNQKENKSNELDNFDNVDYININGWSIQKDRLIDACYYVRPSTANEKAPYIKYTYKTDSGIKNSEEFVKFPEIQYNMFLKVYKSLKYRPINDLNCFRIYKLLFNNEYSIKSFLDGQNKEKFSSKLSSFKSLFERYKNNVMTMPAYQKKPIDPYILAGFANGIAGPGAAVMVGLEQQQIKNDWEKSNAKFVNQALETKREGEQLLNIYHEIEKIIQTSKKANDFWEKLKSEMYDDDLSSYVEIPTKAKENNDNIELIEDEEPVSKPKEKQKSKRELEAEYKSKIENSFDDNKKSIVKKVILSNVDYAFTDLIFEEVKKEIDVNVNDVPYEYISKFYMDYILKMFDELKPIKDSIKNDVLELVRSSIDDKKIIDEISKKYDVDESIISSYLIKAKNTIKNEIEKEQSIERKGYAKKMLQENHFDTKKTIMDVKEKYDVSENRIKRDISEAKKELLDEIEKNVDDILIENEGNIFKTIKALMDKYNLDKETAKNCVEKSFKKFMLNN